MLRNLSNATARRQAPLASLRDWAGGGCRAVWTDAPGQGETLSFYDSTVEEYANQPLTKLTLHDMLEAGRDAWFDPGKVLASARFAHAELPKRLARRLLDLQLLPHIVVSNPHIERVYKAYYHAFATLIATAPPRDLAENERFSALLRRLVDEHAPMLDALACGLREVRRKPLVGAHLRLDPFLEGMLRSRISRRVLAEHHISIGGGGRAGQVGVVAAALSLAEAADFAAARCRQVCVESFGVAPEFEVTGDLQLTVSYVAAHLDYALYELLKNAARAVVERHHHAAPGANGGDGRGGAPPARLPPVQVRICGGGGGGDVTIRISDQGGGIPPAHLSRVWEFGFTTLDQWEDPSTSTGEQRGEGLGLDDLAGPGGGGGGAAGGFGAAWAAAEGGAAGRGRWRMGGLGFGLPLSRLYARYFGGDLRLVSMPGYGVDVFLTLRKLEGAEWAEAEEAAPSEVAAVGGAGEGGAAAAVVAAAALGSANV